MKSKNLLVLCVLSIFLPFAVQAASLPGNTLTNGDGYIIQKDVCNALLGYEHKVAPKSKHPHIIDTAIMVASRKFKADAQGKFIGLWVERWVVQRDDGTKHVYLVRFDAHGAAGTGFKIKPLPKSKA